MTCYLIDTNVFLRAILDDHKIQSTKSKRFLTEIANTEKGTFYTTIFVIMEIEFTLRSLYKFKKNDIADVIKSIINTPKLHVEEINLILKALVKYEKLNVDFVDCLNDEKNYECKQIYSFDKDFDKLDSKRLEP